MEGFTAQSVKQNFRVDIEDSRKIKTSYKLFEFFDDYSYGNSKKAGLLFRDNFIDLEKKEYDPDGKYELVLFMEEGPQTKSSLQKLLEWRKSGNSDEIGHKGGGNKRNIFGHNTNVVEFYSRLNDTELLYAQTRPNKIFNYSKNDDISEFEFRKNVDTSDFVRLPENLHNRQWLPLYTNLYDKIKSEVEFSPNYIIRMVLDNKVAKEYININYWNVLKTELAIKQYKIDIFFKNEHLFPNKTFESIDNIDLIGVDNIDKDCKELDLEILIDNNNQFYLKKKTKTTEKVYNVKKDDLKLIPKDEYTNFISWGILKQYIVNQEHLKTHFNNLNCFKIINEKKTKEDFYGVYCYINNKYTNYLPFEGKSEYLPNSKNNKLMGNNKSSVYYRMVITPNNNLDDKYLDKLISTNTIKAMTNFLNSQKVNLAKKALALYKDLLPKPVPKPNPKPTKKEDGIVYILYLGNNLYKYGLVTEVNNINKRVKLHKSKLKEYYQKYLGDINNNLQGFVLSLLEIKTQEYKGGEELIGNYIIKNKVIHNIQPFNKDNCKNEINEFFICNKGIDYIMIKFLPEIKKLLNH